MAASYHTRSNSFPSTSNPVVSQFDEQLSRLRSSEFASSSTSSTISSKLALLIDLYVCVDELLQLPSSQKAISSQGHEKSVEDALEASIKFLDICSTISDALVQMKERSQELQSILRRRFSKNEIAKEVAEYLRSRKNTIKVVSRELKDLKKIEFYYAIDSNEISDVTTKLRECQVVTLSVLESILVAMAGAKVRSSWGSVVFKFSKSKHIANQQEADSLLAEFQATDATLHPEQVRSGLENMEISIKDAEQGVECLFRHLIKTRTTILNILNF